MQQYHFGSQPVKPWHKQFVKKKPNYVWLKAAMLNRNNCSDWEKIFSWHSGSSWSMMGPLGSFLSAPTILHKESSTCFPLFQLSKWWLQHPCPVLLASPRLPGTGLLCEYRAGPRLSFCQDRLTLPRGSFWCFLCVHTSTYKASFSSLVNRVSRKHHKFNIICQYHKLCEILVFNLKYLLQLFQNNLWIQ